MQLVAPDINREYKARTVGEQAPTSRQTWFSISIGYRSSAPESLTPPRETKGCAGRASIAASVATVSEAFVTSLSLAVTKPASIAAWARARLSNRPRSTRSTSARLPEVISLLLFFTR